MKTCKQCGKTGEEAVDFRKGRAVCEECGREEARARMKEFRKTDAYKVWLEESSEYRKALKAKYRAMAGCKSRAKRAEIRRQKMEAADHVRAQREFFFAVFIGPPTPATAMNDADYMRWRYRNDTDVRGYHKEKRRRHVETVSISYARQQLGIKDAPMELIEAKRLFILIKRQIKELTQ
jgi:hypothetical protein